MIWGAAQGAAGPCTPNPCPPPVYVGDLNGDGVFDLADVAPFAQALADPAGYTAEHPTCDLSRADMNGDDLVNGDDIQPFVDAPVGS